MSCIKIKLEKGWAMYSIIITSTRHENDLLILIATLKVCIYIYNRKKLYIYTVWFKFYLEIGEIVNALIYIV